MKTNRKIFLLLFFQMLFSTFLFKIFSWNSAILASIFYMILAFVSMGMENMKSFTLMIFSSLLIGFLFVFVLFGKELNKFSEIEYIKNQIFITLNSIILWCETVIIKDILFEDKKVKEEISFLKTTIPNKRIYTETEFIQRVKTILDNIYEKGEQSQLIFLTIPEKYMESKDDEICSVILLQNIGNICMESIRNQFDLVGKISHNTIIIFLKNTNSLGSKAVLKRINSNISLYPQFKDEKVIDFLDIKTFDIFNDSKLMLDYIRKYGNNFNVSI